MGEGVGRARREAAVVSLLSFPFLSVCVRLSTIKKKKKRKIVQTVLRDRRNVPYYLPAHYELSWNTSASRTGVALSLSLSLSLPDGQRSLLADGFN